MALMRRASSSARPASPPRCQAHQLLAGLAALAGVEDQNALLRFEAAGVQPLVQLQGADAHGLGIGHGRGGRGIGGQEIKPLVGTADHAVAREEQQHQVAGGGLGADLVERGLDSLLFGLPLVVGAGGEQVRENVLFTVVVEQPAGAGFEGAAQVAGVFGGVFQVEGVGFVVAHAHQHGVDVGRRRRFRAIGHHRHQPARAVFVIAGVGFHRHRVVLTRHQVGRQLGRADLQLVRPAPALQLLGLVAPHLDAVDREHGFAQAAAPRLNAVAPRLKGRQTSGAGRRPRRFGPPQPPQPAASGRRC